MHVKKNLTLNCKSLSTGCQKMTSLQKMIRWPEPLNFSFRWFCCSTFCIWSIFWNTSFWERRVWIARVLPPLTKYKCNMHTYTRCLKVTEKVSFNIASEASYVYILSGQKLFKNAKNGPFWRVFENLKLAVKQCYQTGQF